MDTIDILNRQEFVDKLVEIVRTLSKQEKGSTIALDGRWGSGKTYVLRKFEDRLSLFEHHDTSEGQFVIFH